MDSLESITKQIREEVLNRLASKHPEAPRNLIEKTASDMTNDLIQGLRQHRAFENGHTPQFKMPPLKISGLTDEQRERFERDRKAAYRRVQDQFQAVRNESDKGIFVSLAAVYSIPKELVHKLFLVL